MTLLFLLFVKHAVADLWLQSYHGNSRKDLYWGGHRHYGEHAVLTGAVCVLFVPVHLALLAAVTDWICHWHIDHFKTRTVLWRGLSRSSAEFWRIQTVDQILHYATYFVIVQMLQ